MKSITLNNKNLVLPFSSTKLSRNELKKIDLFNKLVLEKGDQGISEISQILGEKKLKNLKVKNSEIKKSVKNIDESLKNAILEAYSNIYKYHNSQFKQLSSKPVETTKGINLWSEFRPIDNVGLYVPGGSAPLFSSFLMQAIPAIIAGCENITVCTPPDKNGDIDPIILWVADFLKIKNIYKVGGAQAIFAMAYGTKTIPKCLKIFGPGNKYVTEAKKIISNITSIDMPAGPSEVYVVSDDQKKSKFIAADLLSQLEHGTDAHAVVVSKNKKLLDIIKKELEIQLDNLKRKDILKLSTKNTYFVKASSDKQLINFINENAPEHLILMDDNFLINTPKIINAGSVFCGSFSPESFGDYASGSNHTLPTSGNAKTYSGLSVKDFGKTITFQYASPEGFLNLAPTVEKMAEAEKLDAHKNAVSIRENLALKEVESLNRIAFINRNTNETNVLLNLNLDGTGNYNINTGLNYFDHMLEQFSKHGKFDISLNCDGDTYIDEHHTIEDVAITLGEGFKQAIGDRLNLERYASSEDLVMDETRAQVSIDLTSRSYLKMKTPQLREFVGDFPTEMFKHFFISFVNTLGFTCHINVSGKNSHHIVEATFKSFTRALNTALKVTNESSSTKGLL